MWKDSRGSRNGSRRSTRVPAQHRTRTLLLMGAGKSDTAMPAHHPRCRRFLGCRWRGGGVIIRSPRLPSFRTYYGVRFRPQFTLISNDFTSSVAFCCRRNLFGPDLIEVLVIEHVVHYKCKLCSATRKKRDTINQHLINEHQKRPAVLPPTSLALTSCDLASCHSGWMTTSARLSRSRGPLPRPLPRLLPPLATNRRRTSVTTPTRTTAGTGRMTATLVLPSPRPSSLIAMTKLSTHRAHLTPPRSTAGTQRRLCKRLALGWRRRRATSWSRSRRRHFTSGVSCSSTTSRTRWPRSCSSPRP